jgi:hypothetical protein
MIHTLYKTTCIKTDKFYFGVHSTSDVEFGTKKYREGFDKIWSN